MTQFIFKMPDLGEGTVEAEIVAWHTEPGNVVTEDQTIVEVMTDKAAVEVPAPVSGRVVSISGGPGDKIAVGAPLIVFDLETSNTDGLVVDHAAAALPLGRVKASPADRRRARDAGIDLNRVVGSGPGGRIRTADVVAAATLPSERGVAQADTAKPAAALAAPRPASAAGITEIKVIGIRRLIAERMSAAKRTIPHFAYIEEIDVTELEALRRHMNARSPAALTYLPFVVLALARALALFPQCNALYDTERETLLRHSAIHVGIATQTSDGLKVPVVRNVQTLSIWELAAAIRRVAERARNQQATRQELSGSTITVTSLGKLGGIASTPVINAPEVAIIGLNKAVERPVVVDGAIVVRRIMNLSSSFDHRFVDGYDAAAMIQSMKDLLEHPTMIFIPPA